MKNDSIYKNLIISISIIVPIVVALLLFMPSKIIIFGDWTSKLPHFNAVINTLTSIFHLSFAYVEFVDKSSICNALKLDGTTFKGRQIKVLPKRQNVPTARSGPGRSRSSFSRVRGNYGSNFRGRRGRFRGRGR